MKNNEIFRMFRYPSMIKSAAFTAACFGMLAVLLKNSIVFIPEVTEVRLCNVIACTMGIWFGPAGAWGCAVGNLVGDMGGSLTILTVPGFLGNFFSAWLPYKIWCVWGSYYGDDQLTKPSFSSKNWVLRYLLGGFCSVVTCSGILAFSFDLTGAMPSANTFSMIFLNNTGATLLGMGLFAVSMLVPKKLLPYWRTQMSGEKDLVFPASHRKMLIAVILLSLALVIFIIVYEYKKGLSLKIIDEFGVMLPMIVTMSYTAAQMVMTLSCTWRQRKSDELKTAVREL